jgi:hypothetical protein
MVPSDSQLFLALFAGCLLGSLIGALGGGGLRGVAGNLAIGFLGAFLIELFAIWLNASDKPTKLFLAGWEISPTNPIGVLLLGVACGILGKQTAGILVHRIKDAAEAMARRKADGK